MFRKLVLLLKALSSAAYSTRWGHREIMHFSNNIASIYAITDVEWISN
jgi:hypothetical protein